MHGGSGPALLLPHLNFTWPDYLDLRPFTGRFTVITASPRGFATSSRLDADLAYRVRDMADDLVAVVQEVGFDRFFVLGYSFTGAFAPWIAQLTGKADAVVSGGFPIVGDYAYLYPEIQRQSEAAKSDPAAWARVDAAFDNRAALTFYRELSDCPRTRSSVTCRARCSHSGATKTRRWALAAQNNSPPASTATAYNTSRSPATTT